MALYNFDDVAWHIRRLQHARRRGRLIFVLGSGINAPYGLPDWPTLIVRLLLDSGRIRKAKAVGEERIREILHDVIRDPLLQGVAVRSAFAREAQWLECLRSHVNAYDPEDVCDPAKPLWKVATLIASQFLADRSRHIPVLTFNYDGLLEVALRKALGRAATAIHSVSDEEEFFSSIHRAGIFIHHLHGFIDHPSSDIVLDAASYVNVLAAPGHHWSWQCMNSHLFHRDGAAVFLGLSLLDPNLRLLLTQSAARGMSLSGVYVSKPFPPIETESADDIRNIAFAASDIVHLFDGVLRQLSLVPFHVKSWDELPAFLDHVSEENE